MDADATPLTDAFCDEVEILFVRFKSNDEKFAVVQARHGRDEFPIRGAVAHLQQGDHARVEGRWVDHPRHGRQVEVSAAVPIDPTNSEAQLRLLTSLPGIGPSRAVALIELHGDGLFDAMDASAEETLVALPRVGAATARRAAAVWRERRGSRELYVLLAAHRLQRLFKPLLRRHGDQAASLVQSNPYLLAAEPRVGFTRADAIARQLGVALDSPARLEAAILHVLDEAGDRQGHTRLPVAELMAGASRLVGEVDAARLDALARRHAVHVEGGYVSSARQHRAEQTISERLVALADAAPRSNVAVPAMAAGNLTAEQWAAVRRAFAHGASVVRGGPGTGKTYLVRAITRIARQAGWEVQLCAPTGRAGKRLEQSTGCAALTIHRLLEWGRGEHEGPVRCPERPLTADLLVVDEASMADCRLAADLLAATPDGCRVVFVGDPDQLPSVGAGRVLADCIDSETVPVTHLTRPVRQASGSQIIQAAHAIRHGRVPYFGGPTDGTLNDFFFLAETNSAAVAELVCDLVARRLPTAYDLDPMRDILVLSPTKLHASGTGALNAQLGGRLNPGGESIPRSNVRVGDKAMWTSNVNNLELGNGDSLTIENGTILFIEHVDYDAKSIYATDEDGEPRRLPLDRLDDLAPAFATTVHKSQGCEAPIAITVIPDPANVHPNLLARELIYTAVTRAKQVSIVVGHPAGFEASIAHVGAFARMTGLRERLVTAFSRPARPAQCA